jgi:hypothetical protein
MLLAKLTRRQFMQAFKQIAHDAGAGEPLLAGNLLHGLAGGEELFGRVVETQSGDVLQKLTPTSLRNRRDSQASETNSAAATSCSESRC